MENQNKKKIIIYLHTKMSLNDGGATVQYYLADILDKCGEEVYIRNQRDNNSSNNLYNKFVNIDEIPENEQENTVVIYCEGILGNPLNAKYVVRWMLSKLGQNVSKDSYNTWGKDELVYFFNSEKNMIDNNVFHKCLTLFYVNPIFKNLHTKRRGFCYTYRKMLNKIHDKIHPPKSFEITRNHSQEDYLEIFNNYEYFISYDPLTFLNIIASLCGCISVIYPLPNISKKEYYKITGLYEYMKENNVDDIYGLAYGLNSEEIFYAKNTVHMAKQQIDDVQKWMKEKYVSKFINDINNWNENANKLSCYKNSMLYDIYNPNFDMIFYGTYHSDLSHLDDEGLAYHYKRYGRNEKRLVCKY